MFEGGCCEMNFLLWRVGRCQMELQVLEGGCHEMKSFFAEDGVLRDDIAGVRGLKVELVAVAGSSNLTAHARPSTGRGFVDGIGCNRLATIFTLARTFRLLICASSRAFFTFVSADPSLGNFFDETPRKFRLSIFII